MRRPEDINDIQHTPADLKEDLGAYSKVLENLIAGAANKHDLTPSKIAHFFGRTAMKVVKGFHRFDFKEFSPTPPFPLQIRMDMKLTETDIMPEVKDEEPPIDTRIMVEETPEVITDAICEELEEMEKEQDAEKDTPNIFEIDTPTKVEDDDYAYMIALSVPHPDKTILEGALPVYVNEDHELAGGDTPLPEKYESSIDCPVIFSFTPTPEQIEEWSLSYAVRELADCEFNPDPNNIPKTPDYITKGLAEKLKVTEDKIAEENNEHDDEPDQTEPRTPLYLDFEDF